MKMDAIQQFLSADTFAVVSASANTHKYGYKVFHALSASGRETYPINPVTKEIDGKKVYSTIADLPIVPQALSIITPPEVTRQVIAEAIDAGVRHVWTQPGAELKLAGESAREAGINKIDDGSCILVLLARE